MLKNREDGKPTKLADIDLEFCKGCGVCEQVCPVKAIKMK
jgi:pyruvate ferredoxin oxidoreductase delta subunit